MEVFIVDINIMAQTILKHVGGKDNINKNMICISRLRLELKDRSLVDVDAIKSLEGVLGIIEADTFQIVVGTTNVRRVGVEFSGLTGIPLETVEIVCHPGEPCAYNEPEVLGTDGFIGKFLGMFKK